MEIDIQDRKSELEGLNIFITHISSKLKTIINTLGWSEEYLNKKPDNLKVCTVDKSHRNIPKHKIHEHVEKCIWKKEEYLEDELPLSEPNHSKATIILDKDVQEKIINEAASKDPTFITGKNRDVRLLPRSSNRMIADYTADERLALYDYAVLKTKSNIEKVGDINVTLPQTSESTLRNKTIFELLAEERDAKRRRTKYKSVHTNRKSQTEILREVIENQMEMFCDYIKAEEQPDKTVDKQNKYQEPYIKKEIRKSSDRETVRSLDSEKYSRRSDESVTSRKSRGERHKSGSTSKYLSKYEEKLSKHEEKISKFEKKISKYDEEISRYDEKVSKYDEKLRRYEEDKKRRHREFKDRSPIREYIPEPKRVYEHEFSDDYDHKFKEFDRKEYHRYREKRSDDEYQRKHFSSRSRDKHKHYNRR